jgi:hypothetical protein
VSKRPRFLKHIGNYPQKYKPRIEKSSLKSNISRVAIYDAQHGEENSRDIVAFLKEHGVGAYADSSPYVGHTAIIAKVHNRTEIKKALVALNAWHKQYHGRPLDLKYRYQSIISDIERGVPT